MALDVRGAAPRELADWLWDFEARPLREEERSGASETVREARTGFRGKLHKTDAFLDTIPYGTVPAAWSPDGRIGIFESNSIGRVVARLGAERHPAYGRGPYEASRIDAFLDASLVFARDSQLYLLALASGELSSEVHARAADAFATWLGGIERALTPDRTSLVGEDVTLADVCFVAEYALFSNERGRSQALDERGLEPIVRAELERSHPCALAHFVRLAKHPAFEPDVAPYLRQLDEVSARTSGTRQR